MVRNEMLTLKGILKFFFLEEGESGENFRLNFGDFIVELGCFQVYVFYLFRSTHFFKF